MTNATNNPSDAEYTQPDLKQKRKQNFYLLLHKKQARSGENYFSSAPTQRLIMAEDQSEHNVIIDTDVGVDDTFCMANFLALHRKNRCKVLGEDNKLCSNFSFMRAPRLISPLP